MLKKIIEDVEGLDGAIAALYEKKADGKFHLKLEDDDAEPLRRAKDHEAGLRKIAERDLAQALEQLEATKAKLDEVQRSAGKSVQEVREQLEADWGKKLADAEAKHAKEKAGMEETIRQVFVSDVAHRLATELTDVPDLMLPFIEKRLQVEMVDGKPVTRVLTADGKASNSSPDDLKGELLQDKRFERIVRGNDASGGGANGGSGGSGAPKKLKDMGDAERKEWAERDPQGFERAVEAQRQETSA